MSDGEDWRSRLIAVVSIAVLGAGFAAMFLEVPWFWMIWVLGYAVLVPLLAVFLGVDDGAEWYGDWTDEPDAEPASEPGEDPLETLRERYARGELTDEQFERKLDHLLETETLEDVEDARRRLEDSGPPTVDERAGTDDDARTERER